MPIRQVFPIYNSLDIKVLPPLLRLYCCRQFTMEPIEKYNEAIATLNGLQNNASVIKQVAQKINTTSNTFSVQSGNIEMINKYLKRCNINIDKLTERAIHVSGTKGKGSTCALVESILRKYGFSTGFYSSPHLFSVTERIRLNGKPISYELFTDFFWKIYRTLENNQDYPGDMPGYFKFLTILAFHIFQSMQVDVMVIEVGIGGEYDCTNSLRNTKVVGITSLGYDHTSILGNTIESIAWMKGGIMKPGCLAFTCSDQPKEALEVLKQRAQEKKCSLHIIERNLPEVSNMSPFVTLNSSLAVRLAHAWMQLNKYSGSLENGHAMKEDFCLLDETTLDGIQQCVWPGRFQVLKRCNITYYLDGAHTVDSIQHCSKWFKGMVESDISSGNKNNKKILLFNVTNQRNPEPLLNQLVSCSFDKAYFSPNLTSIKEPIPNDLYNSSMSRNASENSVSCTEGIAKKWINLTRGNTQVVQCLTEALTSIKIDAKGCTVSVLVTGSVHLVGNILSLLQPNLWKTDDQV